MDRDPLTSDGLRSDVDTADEQRQCLDLRREGYTIREIATKTGLSKSTVHNRLTDAIADIVQPAAAELRGLELARLDRWQRRLEEQFDDPEQDVCKVVTTALRVQERRAKLLGLDAPMRLNATVHEEDAADAELRELLAEVEAHNAARRAELSRAHDA